MDDFDTSKVEEITIEELFEKWDEEAKKKNLRNLLDKVFPHGIADYRAYYALTHPWKIVDYCVRQVKYAWQRVFRGWDDTAVWSIDSYLAKQIPELIRKLKKDQHGYPACILPEDYEPGATRPEEEEEAIEKEAIEKWNNILDSIAEGFEAYVKYDGFKWNDGNTKEYEEDKKKFETAFQFLIKYFSSLWD